MSKKQMPSIDIGLHLGARAGSMGIPLEDAEADFRRKENPTPYMVARFRTGYIVGQINDRLNYLRAWQPYLNREQLSEMLADIEPVANKWGHDREGRIE